MTNWFTKFFRKGDASELVDDWLDDGDEPVKRNRSRPRQEMASGANKPVAKRKLISGACLCGTIQYTCDAEPAAFINCHCKDCQRCTGSTHAPVLMVADGSVHVLQGETNYFESYGTDGTFIRRHFCPGCGSQMFTELPDQDEWMFIKVGTVDDVSSLNPTMTAWTDSAPHFSFVPTNIPAFPKNPPD